LLYCGLQCGETIVGTAGGSYVDSRAWSTFDLSIQFKFSDEAAPARRRKIARALSEAGYTSRALFGDIGRAKLAGIHTIAGASEEDLETVKSVLAPFGDAIEYVEAAPSRSLKSP
jgi:hypothetical protein